MCLPAMQTKSKAYRKWVALHSSHKGWFVAEIIFDESVSYEFIAYNVYFKVLRFSLGTFIKLEIKIRAIVSRDLSVETQREFYDTFI